MFVTVTTITEVCQVRGNLGATVLTSDSALHLCMALTNSSHMAQLFLQLVRLQVAEAPSGLARIL